MHSGFLTCVSLFALFGYATCDNIIVRTNYGPVSGRQKYILGKNVYAFLGIPFAQPPTGNLRFKNPKKPKPWKPILDASTYPNSCIQPPPRPNEARDDMARVWNSPTGVSEDCLYLNIWTRASNHSVGHEAEGSNPVMLESSALFGPKSGRPVMVWIHGGSLTRGSSSLEMYNGAFMASKMDVVLVSIQYRLGPFGFLYLGTDDAPGNQGMMDQVAALEWVRENIAYFGGNPKQITLFGHAGGVVCVALHLLSPFSSSLFQQAILQSGSPLAWWAVESPHTALDKARLLATLSGCKVPENNVTYLMELGKCLRSVDAKSLESNQWQILMLGNGENSSRTAQLRHMYRAKLNPHMFLTAGYYFDIPFKPVISPPLLPQWPYEILGSGKLDIRHRIMLGVNKDEGMYHLVQSLRPFFVKSEGWQEVLVELSQSFTQLDPMELLAFYIMDENFLHPLLLQATAFEYQIPSRGFNDPSWSINHVLDLLNKVGGDYNVKCPLIEFADFYSRGSNAQVFLYSFEHRTHGATWPSWTGVMQGFEAEYIFGAPFNQQYQRQFYNFTDDERRLSEEMMRFWTNFASTGSPNLNPGEFHTKNKDLYWERYKSQISTSRNTFKTDAIQKSQEILVTDNSRQHMVFSLPQSYLSRNLRRHHCMFWREQLPLMREQILFNSRCSATKPNSTGTGTVNKPVPGVVGTLYPDPLKRTAKLSGGGIQLMMLPVKRYNSYAFIFVTIFVNPFWL
ncbi:hypothetical protein P879_02464 [Paragonimus westermani]|uniref:Carboxylesterase type B domain-containing protein n=1 Tax=Paragonimus westermani TaxID=34504 RepID=A0A8T0D2C6_9TREM|nr:hypothetical protein P879_02464 [Paragonimus westermani]